MSDPSPIQPERITLRVCHDLGWQVVVYCGQCRTGRLVQSSEAANGPGGGVPLPMVLERRLLKCDTCKTRSAYGISVSWLPVGVSEELATWKLYDQAGVMVARLMR